jgi:phosphoribosylanthranilate isomerase
MTWVKVCGLSTEADVEAAVAAGADAVGFVVAERSPRRVSLDTAAGLARGVAITTVLVTVDVEPARLLSLAESTGVSGVQPHGRHGAAAASAAAGAGLFALQPIRMSRGAGIPAPRAGIIRMFDTYRPYQHGGTGATFDWTRIADAEPPFVVAGGLDASNVADAIRALRPWGVDASSGLEGEVGVKDHGKVAAFVREAKQA